MKYFLYLTLALGIVRAVADYGHTGNNIPEKIGVLIVITMFISSIVFVYKI